MPKFYAVMEGRDALPYKLVRLLIFILHLFLVLLSLGQQYGKTKRAVSCCLMKLPYIFALILLVFMIVLCAVHSCFAPMPCYDQPRDKGKENKRYIDCKNNKNRFWKAIQKFFAYIKQIQCTEKLRYKYRPYCETGGIYPEMLVFDNVKTGITDIPFAVFNMLQVQSLVFGISDKQKNYANRDHTSILDNSLPEKFKLTFRIYKNPHWHLKDQHYQKRGYKIRHKKNY